MKTLRNLITVLVLSTFLFACATEMTDELNIVNTAALTIISRQNVNVADDSKNQAVQQSQQRNDGDDDMPDQGNGTNLVFQARSFNK